MPNLASELVRKIEVEQAEGVYKIGDFGPAGGRIIYDKGSFSNGWRYLEAAPLETEFSAEWGGYEKNVVDTSNEVGFGKRNTQRIIEQLAQSGETGRAAQLCASLNFDGFNDWFLPSRDELRLMFYCNYTRYLGTDQSGQRLQNVPIGLSSDTYYWSSSQYDNRNTTCIEWYTRSRNNPSSIDSEHHSKNTVYKVCAVRAF
jgi:hypothetical protein